MLHCIAEVADYISFNVQRSDVGHRIVYFDTKKNAYVVVPDGAKDWIGFIEFKRSEFSDQAYRNSARVIKEVDADLLAIVEVESRPALDAYNSDRLKRYAYNMVIDCKSDLRGIDVGVYSKHPLAKIKSHIFDMDAGKAIFSRDCLEVEVPLGNGKSLWLLINHFKSKSGTNQAGNDAKRKRQAEEVKRFLTRDYDLASDLVIVAGDLNDTPDSDPLAPLLSTPDLHDVLEVTFGEDMTKRWTYSYRKQNQQIDYLLVSTPLRERLTGAGVERRGIAGLAALSGGAETSFPGIKELTDWRDAASDHACVWADFDL